MIDLPPTGAVCSVCKCGLTAENYAETLHDVARDGTPIVVATCDRHGLANNP